MGISEADRLASILVKLNATVLREFGKPSAFDELPHTRRVTSGLADISDLAEIALRGTGGVLEPRFEKTRWSVVFNYKGIPARMRDTKMGVSIQVGADTAESADALTSQIEDKLSKAVAQLNRTYVSPRVQERLQANEVQLENQFRRHRGMVNYFYRRLAESIGEHEGAVDALPNPAGDLEEFFVGLYELRFEKERRQHEIAYLSTALVAGYFAYLQHVLILLTGLSPRALEPDFRVESLLGDGWADQFAAAFGDVTVPRVNRALAGLKTLASDYRNPLLHGSRPEDGIQAEWLPGKFGLVTRDGRISGGHYLWKSELATGDGRKLLSMIRSADEFLETHPYWRWVEGMMPVNFARSAVQRAVDEADAGRAASYIESASDSYDDLVNMDRM